MRPDIRFEIFKTKANAVLSGRIAPQTAHSDLNGVAAKNEKYSSTCNKTSTSLISNRFQPSDTRWTPVDYPFPTRRPGVPQRVLRVDDANFRAFSLSACGPLA
jgi:hypothetical protein